MGSPYVDQVEESLYKDGKRKPLRCERCLGVLRCVSCLLAEIDRLRSTSCELFGNEISPVARSGQGLL
jgi:hypothetical protein